MKQFFHEMDWGEINDTLVFLDIDGTLTGDATHVLRPEIGPAAEDLVQGNRVVLCSNSNNHQRNQRVAEQLNIPYLKTNHRKPSKRLLKLAQWEGEPMVVIGDKFLTDGLFAKRINARFIKVKRITQPSDKWICRMVYGLDDWLARWLA